MLSPEVLTLCELEWKRWALDTVNDDRYRLGTWVVGASAGDAKCVCLVDQQSFPWREVELTDAKHRGAPLAMLF